MNANGLAVDHDGGVFVADSQASKLLYISPDCGSITTVIPQNHFIASPADVEILDTQGLLVVASWSRPGIFYVEVDSSRRLVKYRNTGATVYGASGLTECVDTVGNNGFYFVEQGNRLVFFDVNTQQRTIILQGDSGVVDITDVEYRSCGLFLTANDNNQVWYCTEPNTGLPGYVQSCTMPQRLCRPLCNDLVDSTTCKNLMAPAGLAVGQSI